MSQPSAVAALFSLKHRPLRPIPVLVDFRWNRLSSLDVEWPDEAQGPPERSGRGHSRSFIPVPHDTVVMLGGEGDTAGFRYSRRRRPAADDGGARTFA